MSIWYCIPTAKPYEEAETVLKLWRERGYKLALWFDAAPGQPPFDWRPTNQGLNILGHYQGYAVAVNALVKLAMREDPAAEWFVTGGDDIHPDMNHTADEIAVQCAAYFHGINRDRGVPLSVGCESVDTFGVMQPTGDRWGDKQGAYADRVCGSPWMGREFCRRIYGGHGPIWPEFQHMFEDEHLQAVAVKLGILWQRPDLNHYHEHWVRKANDTGGFSSREDFERRQPAHYKKWSNREHWNEAKAIFDRLKAGGFKEAEDLLP